MGEFLANREDAFELLKKYVKSESLIKHSLSVEAAMAHFAELYDEDIEKWSVIGLLHDIDYEKYPAEHCVKVREILKEEAYPEAYINSIVSHGYGICEGAESKPEAKMEQILYTVDGLTGLITACVLVRPSKSILDLTPKSVNKKWKDKAFAAAVDRDNIQKGLDMLGMDKIDAIAETIEALTKRAELLDLVGEI